MRLFHATRLYVGDVNQNKKYRKNAGKFIKICEKCKDERIATAAKSVIDKWRSEVVESARLVEEEKERKEKESIQQQKDQEERKKQQLIQQEQNEKEQAVNRVAAEEAKAKAAKEEAAKEELQRVAAASQRAAAIKRKAERNNNEKNDLLGGALVSSPSKKKRKTEHHISSKQLEIETTINSVSSSSSFSASTSSSFTAASSQPSPLPKVKSFKSMKKSQKNRKTVRFKVVSPDKSWYTTGSKKFKKAISKDLTRGGHAIYNEDYNGYLYGCDNVKQDYQPEVRSGSNSTGIEIDVIANLSEMKANVAWRNPKDMNTHILGDSNIAGIMSHSNSSIALKDDSYTFLYLFQQKNVKNSTKKMYRKKLNAPRSTTASMFLSSLGSGGSSSSSSSSSSSRNSSSRSSSSSRGGGGGSASSVGMTFTFVGKSRSSKSSKSSNTRNSNRDLNSNSSNGNSAMNSNSRNSNNRRNTTHRRVPPPPPNVPIVKVVHHPSAVVVSPVHRNQTTSSSPPAMLPEVNKFLLGALKKPAHLNCFRQLKKVLGSNWTSGPALHSGLQLLQTIPEISNALQRSLNENKLMNTITRWLNRNQTYPYRDVPLKFKRYVPKQYRK